MRTPGRPTPRTPQLTGTTERASESPYTRPGTSRLLGAARVAAVLLEARDEPQLSFLAVGRCERPAVAHARDLFAAVAPGDAVDEGLAASASEVLGCPIDAEACRHLRVAARRYARAACKVLVGRGVEFGAHERGHVPRTAGCAGDRRDRNRDHFGDAGRRGGNRASACGWRARAEKDGFSGRDFSSSARSAISRGTAHGPRRRSL